MNIFELSDQQNHLERAIQYFWNCWGSKTNLPFYRDCIEHSLRNENVLPKFYIGLENDEIVCSYALLTNDIISRQDLMPWLACLFVTPSHRNAGYAERLLEHGLEQAHAKGFHHLYLSTDLKGFYEKKGWKYVAMGYGVSGGDIKIYSHPTQKIKEYH